MKLTAIIVDDEPLPRAHLRRLLETKDVDVIGECADGERALDVVEALHPDIVFLDVEMPLMNGLEFADALARTDRSAKIVFVTGYTEHAVAAFERDALDYLLKPVTNARLEKTLERVRERQEESGAVRPATVDSDIPSLESGTRLREGGRLPIRDDYAVRLVRIQEILYAEARDRRVIVHTAEKEYRTWYTLRSLEDQLPTEMFLRIHESYLVNVEVVEELLFLGNHTYEVRLSDNRRIPVGRTRYPELQRRLGFS